MDKYIYQIACSNSQSGDKGWGQCFKGFFCFVEQQTLVLGFSTALFLFFLPGLNTHPPYEGYPRYYNRDQILNIFTRILRSGQVVPIY